MKYWATMLPMPEAIHFFREISIAPNTTCLVHLNTGELIVIFSKERDESEAIKSGKFYQKEMSENDWLELQESLNFSITGDKYLCPFINFR